MWAYAALAGLQLASGFQQADIIRQNGQLKASVDNLNARFADLDALKAQQDGQSAAARYANVVDSTVSAQRAAYAGAGQDVNFGTASQTQADAKVTGLMNTLEIQRQAREKAMGYQTQALNIRLGGTMSTLQSNMDAASAESRGIMSAITTGISGYQRMDSTGTGNTSRTGSSTTPQWKTASTSPTVQIPDDMQADNAEGGKLGWYPDNSTALGSPGFFGYGPRSSYGASSDAFEEG